VKFVLYFAISWCVMLAVGGEAMAAQSLANRFTVTGQLLKCDVDAALEGLQPGGAQSLSQKHYREWNWCAGFVDGVLETLKPGNACLRKARVVNHIYVIDLAQLVLIKANEFGAPYSAAEAVETALKLVSQCEKAE